MKNINNMKINSFINSAFRKPNIEFLMLLLNNINVRDISIQINRAISRVEKLSSILFILRFIQVRFLFFYNWC